LPVGQAPFYPHGDPRIVTFARLFRDDPILRDANQHER